MLLVRVAYKSSNLASCSASTATSGWAKVGEFTGTGNSGNGTGGVNVAVFWKEAASSSETAPTIDFSQTVTQVGHVAISYQKGSTELWETPVGAGGEETTVGTAFSQAIASHVSTTAGDMVDFFVGIRDDCTVTVPTFTQTGVTYGTVSEQPATAGTDTSGADGAYDGGYRLASSGTSSAAAVVTCTLSTSETGSAWTTRLRVTLNQSYTPALINQTAATFTPTVTPGAVTYTPALLNQTAVAHQPTITSVATYAPALINQTAATFTPTVTPGAVSISPALLDQTAAAHAPTVSTVAAISLGLIDQTAVGFGPTVEGTLDIDWGPWSATFDNPASNDTIISVGLINQTAAAHAPAVTSTYSVVLGLIDQTAVTFTPTVIQQQFVLLGLIDQTAVLYGPAVAVVQSVSVDLLDQTAVAYQPTVTPGAVTISLALINQAATTFTPTITTGAVTISLALINQTAATFAPTVSSGSDYFVDQTAVAFAPTVTVALGIILGRIGQNATPHAPRVSFPSTQTYSPALINQTAVAHEPSFTGGNGTQAIEFDDVIFATGDYPGFEIFTPSVQGGATNQTVFFARINQTAATFTPSISPISIVVARINRTAVASTPTITGGYLVRNITFGLISNPASAHAPSIITMGSATITPAPPRGTPVRVMIDDVDMASIVNWRFTELETAVGGNASMGSIIIKDVGQTTASFIVGTRVYVDFGPGTRPIWSGYIQRAARRFWFPVDYPDTMQRQWRLSVVDIGILFRKRIAYKKADPADVTGPKYVSETYDDVALATLFEDWLDLSEDDLDLTTEVHRVGYVNAGGQTSYPWNGGMSMGDAVNNIAQLPAAVYGINPSRQFVYADVDSENAPFVLTDEVFDGGRPPDRVGYREATIYPDGSRLVNDFFAWGAGKGSNEMVFHRRQSAESIAVHDRWQDSFFSGGVWKQATIEKITDSAVNGSPGSRRGGKDDRYEIKCVIYDNGLVVGDRVRFRSVIWGYEDVLPVRKVRMTFDTPTDVRYELTLSHEIDRWGFEDPLPPIRIPGLDIPLIDFPPPTDPVLDDCVTTDYLHDLFNRTTGVGLTGPYTTTADLGSFATEWGGGWWRDPDLITGELVFPGEDIDLGGGTHINKVSDTFWPTALNNSGIVIHFDEHDPGSEAFDTHGLISPTSNDFRSVATGDFEPFGGQAGADAYVYYFWGSGEGYNAGLTGSGSYEFYEPTMGSVGDSVGVSGGVGHIQVANGHYGVALPYSVSAATPTAAAWAHPVSTGRFKARFTTVPVSTGPVNVRFRYGPASLTITPSSTDTLLSLQTGSGTTTDSFGAWPASSTQFHTVEMAVNLYAQTITARVYSPTGVLLASMTRALNGESIEGLYEPSIGIRVESTTSTAYRFETTTLETSTYSDGEGIVEDFDQNIAFNESGWGGNWTTRADNVAGPTSGVQWGVENGYGKIRITNPSTPISPAIDQPIDGSSLDVSFSLRGYPRASSILSVYFGRSGSGQTPRVLLGSTTSSLQGTGSGNTASVATTIFNALQPVNVRIRWSTSGIKVWLWADGTEQPETPTLQHAKNIALPNPLVWGFTPGNYSVLNEERWIGPVNDGTAAASLPHAKVAHINLAYGTGVVDTNGTSGTNGRRRLWPTADPGDGRSYGVAWNPDVWETANFGPEYICSVVWGQFGDLGPGVLLDQSQHTVDRGFANILDANGNPFDYEVIVTGECGIGFNGWSSGSGEASVLAAIGTFDYGNAGLPAPGYGDEFINGNHIRTYASAVAKEGGGRTWVPFSFTVARSELGDPDGSGVYHIRWGVHFEGAEGTVRDAGPFDQNGFLTVHKGSLVATFRNVRYKLRLLGVPVLNLRADPCPPTSFEDIPEGAGAVSQTDATPLSSTVYQTPTPYEPFSLVVFVDGIIKVWGVDFTETDPDAGTFTMTNVLGPNARVSAQYTSR